MGKMTSKIIIFSFLFLTFPLHAEVDKFYLETKNLSTLVYKEYEDYGCKKIAYIWDNEGYVHSVKIGDFLGKNNGRVDAIEKNYISIIEVINNGRGDWVEKKTKIIRRVE